MIGALRKKKDSMVSPPYLSRLKLRESPFGNAAKFFFADPERAQTLNMLQHLTQYSEELLLVSGPAGGGKSTLLEQYLARADEDWKVCRVSAVETPDAGELFLTAARCFGLRTEGLGVDALLDGLREHLNQLQQSMTPVLAVDDADKLSDDALEIVVRLAELPGDNGKLVRTILFAEPKVTQQLAGQRFANAPKPHMIELRPLDENQTIAYLQHRMAVAGYGGGPLFLPRELKRIHKVSQGWPGGINAAAHEVMMEKMQTGRPLALVAAAAGAAVIGAVAVGYMAMQSHSDSVATHAGNEPMSAPGVVPERPIVRYNDQPRQVQTALVVRGGETLQITCASAAPAEKTLVTPPLVREVPPPPEPAAEAPAAEAPAAPAAETAPAEAAPMAPPVAPANPPMVEMPAPPEVTLPATAEATPATAAAMPAPTNAEQPEAASPPAAPAAATVPPVTAPVVESIQPQPVPGARGRQVVTLVGHNFTEKSQVTVGWGKHHKRLTAAQTHLVDAEHLAIDIATGDKPQAWSVVVSNGKLASPKFTFNVVASAPAAKPQPPAAAAMASVPAVAGLKDAAWLQAQDPNRFTVQLVGATTEKAALDFLDSYKVTGDIAQLRVQRNGQPWYVLLWGDFADRVAAEQAVAALPAPLREAKPWIRSFAAVHDEMNAGAVVPN